MGRFLIGNDEHQVTACFSLPVSRSMNFLFLPYKRQACGLLFTPQAGRQCSRVRVTRK